VAATPDSPAAAAPVPAAAASAPGAGAGSTRSIAARVQAQASTRQGAKTWLRERATALALAPLSVWFLVAAFGLAGASYAQAKAWLAGPLNATALLLFVAVLVEHTRLGVRVIVEDYLHREPTKLAALLLTDFAAAALGLACVVSVLKVSLGGS
jgi:succinate dehydrogenase / fumarate reductase, membrane anchor subunit